MAHLDLTQTSDKATIADPEMFVRRSQTMLLAAGIASFTIVGAAAIMMALLF